MSETLLVGFFYHFGLITWEPHLAKVGGTTFYSILKSTLVTKRASFAEYLFDNGELTQRPWVVVRDEDRLLGTLLWAKFYLFCLLDVGSVPIFFLMKFSPNLYSRAFWFVGVEAPEVLLELIKLGFPVSKVSPLRWGLLLGGLTMSFYFFTFNT